MKVLSCVAHNKPELITKMNGRFKIIKVLDRNFLKFEGDNFVYEYKFKAIMLKRIKCPKCGKYINDQPAFFQTQRVCQTCYNDLKIEQDMKRVRKSHEKSRKKLNLIEMKGGIRK